MEWQALLVDMFEICYGLAVVNLVSGGAHYVSNTALSYQVVFRICYVIF